MNNFLFGMSVVVGPGLLALGWLIMYPTIGQGPTTNWIISHVLLLLGIGIMLVVGIFIAQRVASAPIATFGIVVMTVGLFGIVAQYVTDVVVALLSDDQAQMNSQFGRLLNIPLFKLAVYDVLPACFFVGLAVLMLGLLSQGEFSPIIGLSFAGIVMIAFGRMIFRQDIIVLMGYIVLFIAFLPIGWQLVLAPK